MTILGIIGCSVLLITGFGLYESINESKDWYFNEVIHFESKLVIEDNMDLSKINFVADEVNGSPIMESSVELVNYKHDAISLMVLNQTDLITFTDDNHEKVEISNDEVSISKKLADANGINVGDTIDCRVLDSGKNVKIKIDKIHSSPFSQGLVMSPEKLDELGLNYTPTSIVTSQHVDKSYDNISIVYLDDLIDGWDTMEATSMMAISAILIFAIVLVLVILYNLNVLSFTEMEQEIATLKILGFKSSYLTKLFTTQMLFFIIIGFLAGIPIAYQFLLILIPSFGDNVYLIPSISVMNLIITFSIIMVVSIIMTLFFLSKIKKLNISDSIKDLKR